MTDYAAFARLLTSTLGPVSAISVSFLDAPPQGIGKFDGTVPSGCSFWKLANEGRSFYTVPSDHYNCPIGSYTHAIDLPDGRAAELTGTIELMTGIGYIRAEEVPGIPRLPRSPAAVAYGPLARATITPDVVIVKGQPGSLMRLQEAAMGAGAASTLPLFGRPTCMALPASMASGTVQRRLRRQPGVHRAQGRRAVPHDPRRPPRGRHRAAVRHRVGEYHPRGVPPSRRATLTS